MWPEVVVGHAVVMMGIGRGRAAVVAYDGPPYLDVVVILCLIGDVEICADGRHNHVRFDVAAFHCHMRNVSVKKNDTTYVYSIYFNVTNNVHCSTLF